MNKTHTVKHNAVYKFKLKAIKIDLDRNNQDKI